MKLLNPYYQTNSHAFVDNQDGGVNNEFAIVFTSVYSNWF